MPRLTVVGGPNGSGKSSIIRSMDFEGKENLLEADAVAKRMTPDDPSKSAVAAGREVLQRTRELIKARVSFAIETTLSGGWTRSAIKEAQAQGFSTHLVYVCVESPDDSVQRVRERVSHGGHDVPDDAIAAAFLTQEIPLVSLTARSSMTIPVG